jgi:hypothetical protein
MSWIGSSSRLPEESCDEWSQPRLSSNAAYIADDVIIFIWTTMQEARAVKEILNVFEAVSGLRTNLAKCSITPIYGAEESMEEIVSILGCQVQAFPIK